MVVVACEDSQSVLYVGVYGYLLDERILLAVPPRILLLLVARFHVAVVGIRGRNYAERVAVLCHAAAAAPDREAQRQHRLAILVGDAQELFEIDRGAFVLRMIGVVHAVDLVDERRGGVIFRDIFYLILVFGKIVPTVALDRLRPLDPYRLRVRGHVERREFEMTIVAFLLRRG